MKEAQVLGPHAEHGEMLTVLPRTELPQAGHLLVPALQTTLGEEFQKNGSSCFVSTKFPLKFFLRQGLT